MFVHAGVNYGWIEVNAQHAFIRDELSKVLVLLLPVSLLAAAACCCCC